MDFKTALRLQSCSPLSLPNTSISSITATVPALSLRRVLISLWNISGAEVIPKGSLRKQKRPTGVIKVVSFLQLASNSICQNPLDASNVENMHEPDNCGKISSSVGRINLSRFTASFNFLRSTQILTLQFFFITGTIGAHQSVASVTSSMIPDFSICCSSSSTFGSNGKGTQRDEERLYGLASCLSSILIGSQSSSPKSPKTLSSVLIESTLLTSFISQAVLRLRRLLMYGPLTTYSRSRNWHFVLFFLYRLRIY